MTEKENFAIIAYNIVACGPTNQFFDSQFLWLGQLQYKRFDHQRHRQIYILNEFTINRSRRTMYDSPARYDSSKQQREGSVKNRLCRDVKYHQKVI